MNPIFVKSHLKRDSRWSILRCTSEIFICTTCFIYVFMGKDDFEVLVTNSKSSLFFILLWRKRLSIVLHVIWPSERNHTKGFSARIDLCGRQGSVCASFAMWRLLINSLITLLSSLPPSPSLLCSLPPYRSLSLIRPLSLSVSLPIPRVHIGK